MKRSEERITAGSPQAAHTGQTVIYNPFTCKSSQTHSARTTPALPTQILLLSAASFTRQLNGA